MLAENYEERQQLTDQLASDAAKVGLRIDCDNSDIINKFQHVSAKISVDGVELKKVEYLGSSVINNGDRRGEISTIIGKV